MTNDIRWKQRYDDFMKALGSLDEAVELARERELADLEKHGLIQVFECTHEFALKLLKDYLEQQGMRNLIGSKDAVLSASKNGLVDGCENWSAMLVDRNHSLQACDPAMAREITERILKEYHPCLRKLAERFRGLAT